MIPSWQAGAPVVAHLPLGPVRRLPGGAVEVTVGTGLPVAAPGQFVMVDTGDAALPHAFTVFRRLGDGALTLLVRPGGRPAQALLARHRAGAPVRAVGPLGRPFPPPRPGGHAWLVAEGGRVAPLHGLAGALGAQGTAATLVVGAPAGAVVDGLRRFAGAGLRTVHVQAGAAASVALERASSLDTVYAAGPEPVLAAICDGVAAAGAAGPAVYVSVEVAMACGVGACYGCPVALRAPDDPRHPYVRACLEGPVFEAGRVLLA